MRYDLNGNIYRLQRNGGDGNILNDGKDNLVHHNFTYNYNETDGSHNKLSSVSMANGGAYGSYAYNNLGQMTSQTLLGTSTYDLTYNVQGKITDYTSEGHSISNYDYNTLGFRSKKVNFKYQSNEIEKTTYYVRDNSGQIISIYEGVAGTDQDGNPIDVIQQTEIPLYGASRLGTFKVDPIDITQSKSVYELKDHLGNVRALAYWNGDLLKTNQWSDYYPYGHKMASSTGELDKYRFGYQGDFAEEDEETGWNFFEARTYDPVIGRWMAVDPARLE